MWCNEENGAKDTMGCYGVNGEQCPNGSTSSRGTMGCNGTKGSNGP